MSKIYFFPSVAPVFNDKIAPVILELARQGHRVDTIIIGARAYQYFAGDAGGYAYWFKTFTRIRPLMTSDHPSLWQKIFLRLRSAWLFLEMSARRDYLAFFDSKPPSPFIQRFGMIAKKRGRAIGSPSQYVDFWKNDVAWEEKRKDPEVARILGKSEAAPPRALDHLSTALIFHPDLADLNPGFKNQERIILPHPKLQPWWKNFVREHPAPFDDSRLETSALFLPVFLTHHDNYFFEKEDGLDVLIPEIVAGIRAVFPEMTIVLKPKETTFRKQMDWFEELLERLGDKNLVVTDTPVSLLQEKAIVGICTGNTSAQFEFMLGNAPWIEYARYSDFWKNVYPKETYTLDYGGYWAKTPEELTGLLSRVKNGNLPSGSNVFRSALHYYDQPVNFDFFYGANRSNWDRR